MSADQRVKNVECVPGLGWIARCPRTGKEIVENFYWSSRSVARAIVAEHRMLGCEQRYSACNKGASSTHKTGDL